MERREIWKGYNRAMNVVRFFMVCALMMTICLWMLDSDDDS